MLWTIPSAIFLLALLYYTLKKPQIRRNGCHIRHAPDSLLFFGNVIQFLKPRHLLFDWFVRCQRKFGLETIEISVPSLPSGVVIHDPNILEFVLKNESTFTKGEFFRERSWDLFGYGIINANGDLWKAQRKAGMKFFAGSNLDVMVEEVLPEVYGHTRERLLDYHRNGKELDLQAVFIDLTTRVVGLMAYDMHIDSESPFGKSFDYASDRVGYRFQNPLWRLTEIFDGAKFRAAKMEVKKFGRKIVTTAKKRRANAAFESLITNEKTVFGSLIDSLIESFAEPTVVADSALNFLSAGRDTTAQSLTWTFYLLMRNPTILQRLRQEINDFVSTDGATAVSLTPASLQTNQIPYTMAVFYEALRLCPPVPFEIKQCEEDVILPDQTFMPSGSIIVWCIWAMNRNKQIYGDDADLFRPERWLDEFSKMVTKSAFEFPTFNGGPRACLGKKMAELIAAFVIISVIREFEFDEVRDEQHPDMERVTQNSLTLPMKNGLPCRVRTR